jgi:hypothetical protein
MQEILSFDRAPPISAPLRYFLTAPLFAIAAGCLLLWTGPELLASRWSPAALALTHLITAGFMMQVMLGAMQQLLPVMAGANIARPLLVATVVHAAITLGALCLVTAFLVQQPWLFACAVVFMSTGVFTLVLSAAHALIGVPTTSPIIRGLRLALVGLSVTVAMGLLQAVVRGWSLSLPIVQLANVHLGWGFVAWGCALLGAVGFVAVPMFQQTPSYPSWFGRGYGYATLGLVMSWTAAELLRWDLAASVLSIGVVAMAASLAGITLYLHRQSRRPTFDAVHRLWWVAMVSALAACALWVAAQVFPILEQWQGWPLLFGTLVLFGGFMSVMVGMLYKIVPFLIWLHLQNRGLGRLVAPNMKKVLAQSLIDRQTGAHFCAFGLLVLAVMWPQWFVYPAGVALVLANTWLLHNLLSAVRVYRVHMAKIALLETRQIVRQ